MLRGQEARTLIRSFLSSLLPSVTHSSQWVPLIHKLVRLRTVKPVLISWGNLPAKQWVRCLPSVLNTSTRQIQRGTSSMSSCAQVTQNESSAKWEIFWKNWASFANSSQREFIKFNLPAKGNMQTMPINITSSVEPAAFLRTFCVHLDENALQIIHLYWTSHFPNMTTQSTQPVPPTHYWVDLSLRWCQCAWWMKAAYSIGIVTLFDGEAKHQKLYK